MRNEAGNERLVKARFPLSYDTRWVSVTNAAGWRIERRFWVALGVLLLAALRLCHVHLLWADEDYHLAAALQILHGKLPYRSFWYDKPPLSAFYYLIDGALPGWPLRLLDTGYVLLACYLIFRLARAFWTEAEGYLAALLLAFFLAFTQPSAGIAFAVDALMLAPHIAAMYFAYQRRPAIAGLCCAIAFLVNPKGLFVFGAAASWLLASWLPLSFGFVAPLAAAFAVAHVLGCWPGYYEQVWRWGWIYASQSPLAHPVVTGVKRTAAWLGFQAALVGGGAFAFAQCSTKHRRLLISWLAFSAAAVCLGERFEPRYYLQVLPPLTVAASRGIVLLHRRSRRTLAVFLPATLLAPLLHFGPHYVTLAYDNFHKQPPQWSDVRLDLDSQDAAQVIRQSAHPQDTLFVWGYRPDIYVYTRLTSDGKFWDSQPLTGVPADRHLHATRPIFSERTAGNRRELAKTEPAWIVDGLGPLNPALEIGSYPDLHEWLKAYRVFARTKFCVIYRRNAVR